jgi:Flp pilus assembly protein TadD
LYQECLTIKPNQAGTLAALGMSYHQLGEVQEALNYYHRANFVNYQDSMV